MATYRFSAIASILHARPVQLINDCTIELLLTDSRKLLIADKTLFFSISSVYRKADIYIEDLYLKGVRCFIVDANFSNEQLAAFPEANFIQVENVLSALQAIASYHRSQFHFPVIGISGSNGKTIIKEWLFHLLADDYEIVRSPKSYNSQIGVPLSVWQMNNRHELAIFEAGISLPGEMKLLERIIQPNIGIFTNLGEAHSAGFESIEHKLSEKTELFKNCETLVFQADDELIAGEFLKLMKNHSFFPACWSRKKQAWLQIISEKKLDNYTLIEAVFENKSIRITVPFTDAASLENIIHCWCILLQLKVKDNIIEERMHSLKPLEMRLQLKHGNNNCSIINDSYSADITSLMIALDFLQQQHQHNNKTVIISDILESGKQPEELYSDIAHLLKEKKISKLIGVGPEISAYSYLFSSIPSQFFSSTEQLISRISDLSFKNETILLKGARKFEFEKISYALEEKTHETVMEINLAALRHNLTFYRSLLKPGVKIMAMVKAFSYGSGSFEIANILQHSGINYLAVAYADEGVQLRKAGINLPIMVMNTEAAGFENLIRYSLEPELYSFAITAKFLQFLRIQKIEKYPVHVKLDTGMHRLGFESMDIDALCSLISESPELIIRSVFSHLAASGEQEHDTFTKEQSGNFIRMADQIREVTGYHFIRHIGNSSAIHRHPDLQFDMIRLGIGLYGVDADPYIQRRIMNVSTLKTTISQIKHILPGDSVGYSRKTTVNMPATIATVRVGYADGYPRALSNGHGFMLVNGKRASVIGNVCMDMTMLDITGIEAEEGDSVIVFGDHLSISEVADAAGTIAYEMLTGVSQRVKRVYFEE